MSESVEEPIIIDDKSHAKARRIPAVFFIPHEPITYPGYKGGNKLVENLVSYNEDVVFERDNFHVLKTELQFDIERHVTWDENYKLLPFTYSMMIDGYYPFSRNPFRRKDTKPSLEEFDRVALSLDGFIRSVKATNADHALRKYKNPDRNIFVNRIVERDGVCVGVIQIDPVTELNEVLDVLVPYAVSVFNQLSPTRKITPNIVEQAIALAIQSNALIPRKRDF